MSARALLAASTALLAACDIEPNREPASLSVVIRNRSEEAQRVSVILSYSPETGDRVTTVPMDRMVLDNRAEVQILERTPVRPGAPVTFRVDTETVAPFHTMTMFREIPAESGDWTCDLAVLPLTIGAGCTLDGDDIPPLSPSGD